jgi:hypothetical protein
MVRILLAAIVGGGVLAYMGFNEMKLAGQCQAEPTAITVDEIAARNGMALDNAHVVLGEFYDAGDLIYEADSDRPGAPWTTAWVPVVGQAEADRMLDTLDLSEQFLAGGEPTAADEAVLKSARPAGGAFPVVLKLTDCRGPEDAQRIMMKEKVQGVAINQVESIDSETRRLLTQSLPGIQVDDLVIIEVDRTPPGTGGAAGMLGGGVALAGAGVAGGVMRVRRRNG